MLPKSRKVFCWDAHAKRGVWQDQPLPELAQDTILVKVESSVIHPSDLVDIGANIPPGVQVPPQPMGSEGAGIVVHAGPGKGSNFMGKKVALMVNRPGIWSDYVAVHINECLLLNDDVTWEEAATAMGYPLAAIMILNMAQKMQTKAVVNTAANSTIGRMILRLLQSNGIEVINIVRKAEKAAELAAEGARYLLNSNEPEFDKKFVELCMKLQPKLVLECVGGDFTTRIVSLSPPGSTICIYGSIAKIPTTTINTSDLYAGKTLISGSAPIFWNSLRSAEKMKPLEMINKDLRTSFKTKVLAVVPFSKIEEAIRINDDNKKGASVDGKVILKW